MGFDFPSFKALLTLFIAFFLCINVSDNELNGLLTTLSPSPKIKSHF